MVFCAFVLPFALAFIFHDLEEVCLQHKWVLKNKERIVGRFPFARKIYTHLEKMSTAAFTIAAIEELLVIVAVSLVVAFTSSVFLWDAVFLAFSFHLLIHIAQGVALRMYVPGLVSSLMLLAYAGHGVKVIFMSKHPVEFAQCLLLGIVLMVVNLCFAHWLGLKLSRLLKI